MSCGRDYDPCLLLVIPDPDVAVRQADVMQCVRLKEIKACGETHKRADQESKNTKLIRPAFLQLVKLTHGKWLPFFVY